MAQLTWRNVDAPSFADGNELIKLAAQQMQAGFQASRDSLEAFQKSTTQEESAKALAASIGVTDPAKLKEVLGGFNKAYLSPDTIQAIAKRPQEAANLASTQASTASTTIANEFNTANNPLKLEGSKLDNSGKLVSNAQAGANLQKTIFDNDVAKKQHEAAPAWNQQLAQYRADAGSADPAAQTRARMLAASPEFAARAAAAGVSGEKLSTVLTQGDTASANAVKLKSDWLTLDEASRKATLATTTRQMSENLLAAYGGPAGATRAAQEDTTMPPELRDGVVKTIAAAAPNYRTAPESEVLMENARPAAAQGAQAPAAPGNFVSYKNQGATRDKPLAPNLVQAMGFLPQMGITMQVTSGGQDGIGEGDKRTGSTRHDHGGAGDVQFIKDGRALSWENAADIPVLQQIARQARTNGVTGIGAGPGYMNPTTTHIGFGSTAIWGAKGGQPYAALAEAVGGVAPSGDRVQQALSRAGQPLQAPTLRDPSGPVRQLGPAGGIPGAAPAFNPGVKLETPQNLSDNFKTVTSMLSSAATTSQMDAQLNPAAPVVEAFAKPPEKASTVLDVAAQLHKQAGDKEESLFSSRLNERTLTDAVQRVVSDYNVTPDIAGALIESSAKASGFILFKGRSIDYGQLKSYVDRFVESEGPRKGQPRTELLRMMDQKQSITKQATEVQQNLAQEKQIWLEARSAAKNGNTRVDTKAADERYANAQRAAEALARKLQTNPNLLGNSRSNTGR